MTASAKKPRMVKHAELVHVDEQRAIADALAQQRLEILRRLARYLDRMAPGHDDERKAFNALFAHLAEHGR